jgi:hypothetical protein
MRWSKRFLIFALAPALAYLAFVFLSRRSTPRPPTGRKSEEQTRRQAEFDRTYGGSALKILQFYSPNGDLMEGESTLICYGVLNAKHVRIEPRVEGVGVAVNRCVPVAPKQATRYTLIAEGKDGSVAAESFVIRTHPDPYTLPNIKRFGILRTVSDREGAVYLLSFDVENAEEVSIDPRVFGSHSGAPSGTFYVAPKETTTYTLTAKGARGRTVRQQLTVEVPPRN